MLTYNNKVAPQTDTAIINDVALTFPSLHQSLPTTTCRICWQQQSMGSMISPCICTGSMEKVHEKCMIKWIYKQINANKVLKISCEICLQKISYQTQVYHVWHPQNCCNKMPHISTYLCGFLLGGLLVLTILSIVLANRDQSITNTIGQIIIIIVLVLDCVMLVVVIGLIFRQLFMEKKCTICKVNNRADIAGNDSQSSYSSYSQTRTSRVSADSSDSVSNQYRPN